MKRRICGTLLLGAYSSTLWAGGLKGNLISDEALFAILFGVLLILVLSVVFSLAYKRTSKTIYLLLGSLFTIPFFLCGIYCLVSLSMVLPALLFLLPCAINGILISMAKS